MKIDYEDDDVLTLEDDEDLIVLDDGEDEEDETEGDFDESLVNRKLEARWRAHDKADFDMMRRIKESGISAFITWLKRSRKVGNFEFDILGTLTFSPSAYKASHETLTEAKNKRRTKPDPRRKKNSSLSKEELRAIKLEEQRKHVHYTKFWDGIWEEVFSKWFLSALVLFLVTFGVAAKVVQSAISAMCHGGSKLWHVMLILIVLELAWNCYKRLRAAWVIAVERTEATIASREGDIAKETAAAKEKERKKRQQEKKQNARPARETPVDGPVAPSRRGHNRRSGGDSPTP